MAALPSPTQVAGSHTAIYEAYYHQVDPQEYGQIRAMEAARFLKKSQLSDVILSKIWDKADPHSCGALDKSGFYVALKLCALAQQGKELSPANLIIETAPPKMGEIPVIPQKKISPTPPVITSISNGEWSIKPSERAKYDQLFDNLQPINGYIPGNKVKGVLMDSKLPLDTLGRIWDLADMDKDGMLDRHEFVVAMHLVYKALEKYAIPNVLPPELMPSSKRKDISTPISKSPVPVLPVASVPPIPPLPNTVSMKNFGTIDPSKHWVVSSEDQIAAEKLFLQADLDMDGYVSGIEIKDVFLQSGLPQPVLAQIWGLCDMGSSGKLNKEQFALAMWLIKQKLRGLEPPQNLTSDMIPPSMRQKEGVVENNNITGYSNPELDMISKDIVELARERHVMEQDIAQKEADIKIKHGEIKNLQSELDTLASTLKQLENQKGEAQKRLNDLKAQRSDVDRELNEVEQEMCEEQKKVDKLRQQAEEQESVLRVQEDELNSKRQELEGLRQEEQQLEQQQNKNRDQLNELTKNLQDTQLQISQAKAKITNLEEQQRQMTDAIALYDSALAAGDATLVPDTSLNFNPEIEDLEPKTEPRSTNEQNDAHSISNGPGFGKQDPFASNKAKDAFQTPDPFTGGFTSDPFTGFENNANQIKQEGYDPFGDGKKIDSKNYTATVATKDPFGDDPFANLHAPTRSESPSPALPPKKAKQPPPRPAPPRPSQGPSAGPLRAAPAPPTPSPTPDPFANANSDPFSSQQTIMDNNNTNFSSGGFADFANFDPKPEPITTNRVAPAAVSRPGTTRATTASRLLTAPSSNNTFSLKLPDFTEDPFRDYRYEDPFNIADPFADETEDLNANKNTQSTTDDLDPFGLHTDFTNNDSKIQFTADFGKAFSNDDAFSVKKKTIADLSDTLKSKLNLNDKKMKNDHSNNNNNSKKKKNIWNGNSVMHKFTEEEQFAWASEQSIKAEEERRKRKDKEEADLALALRLSQQEKSARL